MPKVCPVCDTTYPDANVFCPADGTTLRVAELDGGLIGAVVADRYLVTDLLGEGGMGKVYLARHVRLPQQAAIKVLRAELVQDASSVARFTREASNASQIADEHVARVYDFGETSNGLVYLAMEYVAGNTLRHIIETEGPLPPRRTAGLIRQIAAGLDAAHHLPTPLIHRDLKPDNVLVVVTPAGRDRVKVMDFGIAKAFGADARGLTKTGFIVGTPEFMSPEQLLGESLDARSDVYALGLVAFQCLTGALPFEMTTPERALLARLTDAPHHLLDRTPGVAWPPALEALFDAVLSRDRAGRPESAGAFAERFAAAVDEGWPDAAAPRAMPTPVRGVEAVPVPAVAPAPPPRPAPAATAGGLPRWVMAAGAVALLGGAALLARGRSADRSAEPAAVVATDDATDAVTADSAAAVRTPDSTGQPAARTALAGGDVATRGPVRATPAAADGAAPDRALADDRSLAARALDSLATALEERRVDADQARALGRSIRALLPRLGRDDRTRAQIGLVRASILSGDMTGACDAVRAGTSGAARAGQRAELRTLNEQLGCE